MFLPSICRLQKESKVSCHGPYANEQVFHKNRLPLPDSTIHRVLSSWWARKSSQASRQLSVYLEILSTIRTGVACPFYKTLQWFHFCGYLSRYNVRQGQCVFIVWSYSLEIWTSLEMGGRVQKVYRNHISNHDKTEYTRAGPLIGSLIGLHSCFCNHFSSRKHLLFDFLVSTIK